MNELLRKRTREFLDERQTDIIYQALDEMDKLMNLDEHVFMTYVCTLMDMYEASHEEFDTVLNLKIMLDTATEVHEDFGKAKA